MTNFLLILLALALVFLNAFFVAAEFGMVKLRNTRVEAIKDIYFLRGRILAEVHKNLDAYLSACQLGITLASLGLGWIGEPAFAHLLGNFFINIGITNEEVITIIAFIIAFAFISFLHIVIGELMPKSLAIRQSEKISLWTAVPLYGFYWFMYPAIWFLNTCATFFLKLLGLTEYHKGEFAYSSQEIKYILSASHLHGDMTKEEMDMLEHTLEFADLKVTEVMRPREEMISINITNPIDDIMKTVTEHRYSRYPVYDSKKNQFIGILHVKDLFATIYQAGDIVDLMPMIRPVLKVSGRLPTLDLLRKLRGGMPHFALVYSRQEILLGFVTFDNLLQVLVGRIKDEFHLTREDWVMNKDGTFTVKGDCSIYSLEQALGKAIVLPPDADVTTLSGLIFYTIDAVPVEGDRIEFDEFNAVIEKAEDAKLLRVKVISKDSE